MPHILVVEDESAIREAVRAHLQRQGFTVDEAGSGEEALPLAPRADLVLLDARLPGMDGFEVLRRLQAARPELAVLLLTARTDDVDKIVALEMGADDYVTKPFNPRELVARVRAVLRRTAAAGSHQACRLAAGGVIVDVTAHTVSVGGRAVLLTPREFEILKTLMEQPGRVFTREELMRLVWGEPLVGDPKTVDVYARRIREKLEADPGNPTLIQTVWGVGYRFNERHA